MTRGFGGSSSGGAGGVSVRIVRHLEVDGRELGKQIGAEIGRLVADRTQSGLDTSDRPFAGYEPRTEETGGVDLYKTGRMLRSLRTRTSQLRTGVRVFLAVGQEHADQARALHFGTRYMEPRPWLGLSPKDLEKLSAILEKRPALRSRPGPT